MHSISSSYVHHLAYLPPSQETQIVTTLEPLYPCKSQACGSDNSCSSTLPRKPLKLRCCFVLMSDADCNACMNATAVDDDTCQTCKLAQTGC